MADGGSGAAVVPIKGVIARPEDPQDDPWRMLAERTGMLVTWEPSSGGHTSWGQTLAPTSAIARQLAAVVERSGFQLATRGSTLFRLQLPAGQTLSDLVPAVGGGFRGFTRAASSGHITGQARLVSVGGATAGGIAGLALGPVLGLLALSVATEMIAQKQQRDMLQAIGRGVSRLEEHELDQIDAKLNAAEHAITAARFALLDEVSVPQAVGLSSSVAELSTVKFLALDWLDDWTKSLVEFEGQHVEVSRFEKALDHVAVGGFRALGRHVEILYRSLVLDSRAQVVGLVEQAVANPDRTVENFEALVRQRLQENAAHMDAFKRTLRELANTRLRLPRVPNPVALDKASRIHEQVLHLAWALADAPQLPPVLAPDHSAIIECEQHADGSVTIVDPAALTA